MGVRITLSAKVDIPEEMFTKQQFSDLGPKGAKKMILEDPVSWVLTFVSPVDLIKKVEWVDGQ